MADATERRWPWLLCVLAALVMIGAMMAMAGVPGQAACDGTSGNAMLRFEFVTSEAQLAALFGREPCLTRLVMAMDAVNRIDMAAYIPAFTAFQIFAALGLWWRRRRLAAVVMAAALVAMLCDYAEDMILMTKTAELMLSGSADGDALVLLMPLVGVKFALLALAAMLLGWAVRADGGGWRWAGVVMMAGGAVSLIGVVVPTVVGAGIGLAWVVLLGVALVRAWRPAAVAQ